MSNIYISELNNNFNNVFDMIIRILPYENFEKSNLISWVNSGKAIIYVARDINEEIIGNIFVCFYDELPYKFVYISSICVEKSYRGKGIGKMLIKRVTLDYVYYPIWAKISVKNIPSLKMFLTLGFIQRSHKFTPNPLSKDCHTNYYPFIKENTIEYDIYKDSCRLQDKINKFQKASSSGGEPEK